MHDPDLHSRATRGDRAALDELLVLHRDRLLRMVRLRLDPRLRPRLDPGDVVQDTYLEAVRRFDDYVADPDRMPLFLWLRFLAGEKVLEAHRRQLGALCRDARAEVRLHAAPFPSATSASLAFQLLGRDTAPDQAAARAELRARVQELLETMPPLDREILTLRHFERLTNQEVAEELGLQESAASKRYVRALRRLSEVLGDAGGALL